jgi:colicin import membrane protein
LLAKQREAELQRAAESERLEQARREREEKQRLEREVAAKRAAEEQRLAAQKRLADEKLAKEKAAAEDLRQQREREAELRRRLLAEERGAAARSGPAADQWKAQIRARIERAWIRPPSARPGVECEVAVTQVPGGEVTSVRVESCTGGDDALRSSVETAVYRASPLPLPPDPSLFERNLRLTFKPND